MESRDPKSHKFVHYDPNLRNLPGAQLSQIRSHARKVSSNRRGRCRSASLLHSADLPRSQRGTPRNDGDENASKSGLATGPKTAFDDDSAMTYILPQASSTFLDPLTVLSQRLTDPVLRSLWHEAVNQFWPIEQHVPMAGQEPLVWAFLKHCLRDDLLFHCITAALATLHDARSGVVKQSPRMLKQQNRAIVMLRDEVAKEKIWRTDEFLLALLCMTPGEPIPELVADPRPHGGFTPILIELQYLKSNGLLRWNKAHKSALCFACRQRGGIATINLSGLAELMQNNALVEASHTLSKPTYSMCNSYQDFYAAEVPSLRDSYRTSCQQDLNLTPDEIGSDLHNVFWDMRAYVDLLKMHTQGLWTKLDMPTVATHRNIIQYRLLSGSLDDKEASLNKLALIGAQIFTLGAIYPLPDRKPQITLSTQLHTVLEHESLEIDLDFLTWLLVIASIATADLEQQTWFIVRLAEIYQSEIKDNSASIRSEVMSMMQSFVWMDTACNEGFFHVWAEVERVAHDDKEISLLRRETG